MQDVDVTIITRGGTITGEYSLFPQVWLAKKKKVQFDVNQRKTHYLKHGMRCVETWVSLPIYEMNTTFDSTFEEGPSQEHGTLTFLRVVCR